MLVPLLKTCVGTLLFVLLVAASVRAAAPVSTLPSDTDPRISAFNAPHLAWLPAGRSRNQLLVFLPGTGGTPEKGLFHPFAATAAGLGYHVVALMYPNNLAAQKKCSRSADPDAYLKFRNAIIHGGGSAPAEPSPARTPSRAGLRSCSSISTPTSRVEAGADI